MLLVDVQSLDLAKKHGIGKHADERDDSVQLSIESQISNASMQRSRRPLWQEMLAPHGRPLTAHLRGGIGRLFGTDQI